MQNYQRSKKKKKKKEKKIMAKLCEQIEYLLQIKNSLAYDLENSR